MRGASSGRENMVRPLWHRLPVVEFGIRAGAALVLGLAIIRLSTTPAAARDAAQLPPLTVPPTAVHLTGKMVLAAMVTPDLVSVERFYANLFGWSFTNAYLGQTLFGEASLAGRTVAAIAQRPMAAGSRPAWRSFLSTADVEQSVGVAVAHGATVLVPPHDLARLGRDALLMDPQGAVFGLLAATGGDPPDAAAVPGTWIWSSLVTTAPVADADFYRAVLGYEVFPSPDPREADHLVLASGTFARAGVNPIPTSHAVSHPRWISFVRVADIGRAAAEVRRLGGAVLVAPHQDLHGGTIALVADPQGALFGLLQWSEDETVGDPK